MTNPFAEREKELNDNLMRSMNINHDIIDNALFVATTDRLDELRKCRAMHEAEIKKVFEEIDKKVSECEKWLKQHSKEGRGIGTSMSLQQILMKFDELKSVKRKSTLTPEARK